MLSLLARRTGKSLIGRGTRNATTSSIRPSPYLLLPMVVVGDSPGGNGEKVVNFNFYDLENKKPITIAKQSIPPTIFLSRTIGSSRGWIVRINNEDLTVHLTNFFNPSSPKSTHKVISLPPLFPPGFSKSMATLQVRNVSLSCSPDNLDEDCIVAVKFKGSCIAFFITGDSEWKWRKCDSLSSRFDNSFVVYSKKDHTFYLTPPIDTFLRKDARDMQEPEFPFLTYYRQLGTLKLPKMGECKYELLRRCTKTKHLVETPSGDFFIIVQYALGTCQGKPVFPWETKDLDRMEVKTGTMWFMLYSHDPISRVERYVQDIGDLCVFLGRNEPFCVQASMYPELKPNSIYFTDGNGVYLYNIADQTFCILHRDGLMSTIWLQPIMH